jgi:hypothetical protein
MYREDTIISSVKYRLLLAIRMALFFWCLLFFAGIGLLDAILCTLWPTWRFREVAPYRVSASLTRFLTKIFPLILVVPCSWRRPYRVLRLDYPRFLRPRQFGWVEMVVQNTGSEVWRGEGQCPCCVGVIYPLDGSAFYVPGEWISAVRPAELSSGKEVAPGMTVDFRVPLQAPQVSGRYREVWGMLIEGRGWLPTMEGIKIQIEVIPEV